MKEKGWERMKKELSQIFSWICQYAVRDKKKRRANGGIITDIRIELKEIEITEENANDVQKRRIKIEEKIQKIMTIYNGENMKVIKKILKENCRVRKRNAIYRNEFYCKHRERGRTVRGSRRT